MSASASRSGSSLPFTPFHFGPGLFAKGLALRSFSWGAFVAANVVIDLESLYNLLRGAARVHVHLHTFVGAAVVGLVVSAVMIWGSRFWNAETRLAGRSRTLRAEVSRGGIFAGAMLGALTHPILDGMMHSDIRPFAPFSSANPLYAKLDIAELHTACVVAGLAGLALVVLRRRD